MATRGGGISGAVYALVIFVFLFVIATSLAILFYTQKDKAIKEAADAKQAVSEQVSTIEKTSDEYLDVAKRADEAQEDRTIFGQLRKDVQLLTRLHTGSESSSIEEVKTQLRNAGLGAGKYTVPEIKRLAAEKATAEKEVADLKAERDKIEARIKSLEKQIEIAQASDTEKVKQLTANLDAIDQKYKSGVAALQRSLDDIKQEYDQAQTKFRGELREKVAEIQALRSEIDKREAKIKAQARIINENRLNSPDMTLEFDGKVVQVIPRDNLVYIDLGRDDRVILGMTFEVFDHTTGVQTEVQRNGQLIHVGGKATIEVVRFSDSGDTTICRVIRQSFGRPIVKGDIVSNIVYDKNRTFKFFVMGDFDINGDGRATPSERERIGQLINLWGGKLVTGDTMPVDTDFLVLGERVEFPQPLPDDPPPTLEQVAEHERKLAEFRRFAELEGQARELSIPLLNQNRFLTLIGFYDQ